jgi:hypothetical protein
MLNIKIEIIEKSYWWKVGDIATLICFTTDNTKACAIAENEDGVHHIVSIGAYKVIKENH